MAVIPIRDIPGEAVEPSGDELILIDNGIAMQKASINDAVTPKATEIADDKIAALNLGTASQADVEDFATAAQGELADTAVQPARTITAGDGLTGGGDLSADRTISLNSASIASLAKADTAVQSVVAGANVTVDATDPRNPIISAIGGGAASTDFATVADLLADDNDKIGYAGSGADTEVLPGDIITAQGFRYEVAASDATDEHITTAGGVKLYEAGFVFTHIDRLARVSGSEEISFAKLTQGWRSGSFVWDGSDLSSEVTADPERGIYVPPISDATGASGAWVRQYDGPVRFEWWGADPTGGAVATASIQAALDTCVALGLEDIDASGSSFNMTGGTTVSILADGARIRVNKGNFFSTDGAEENILFRFILLAEVEFIGSCIDRNYLGSADIEDYNSAHAIACYGVGLFRVDNCNIRNVKGDGLYGARDRVDGVGTDRNMGDVFWTNNKLHNCKRNYAALTSYMNALVSGNICTADPAYVWARSAVIDFEPNNSIEDMGYATVTNNVIKVTGAKNPLRWLVSSDRIPADFYESVIVTGNTIECTDVLQAIFVDCREKLKYLKISENTVRCTTMAASGSNPTGILISSFTGIGGVDSNIVDIMSGAADTGIYYSVSNTTGKATANDNTIIYRPSGDFRGIRANVSAGAQITVDGNVIIANGSSQQAILLSGQSGSKATTLSANNNSYAGFTATTRIQVANAVRACAIGNTGGGTVSGSGNDNQLVSPNI